MLAYAVALVLTLELLKKQKFAVYYKTSEYSIGVVLI